MDPIFERFIISEDTDGLIDYLNDTPILPDLLNMWFRQAARLPDNWNDEHDRNAWLQAFYEQYVPDDIRQCDLTDRHRFQKSLPPRTIKRKLKTPMETKGSLLKTYPLSERRRIIKDFSIQPEDVDYVRFLSDNTSETIIYVMAERPE